MTTLQIRKPPFDFDGVEFMWNPANPAFAAMANTVSFWVLGLERYFVRIVNEADALIRDPDVRDEARLFVQQEAIHSKMHRRHARALIARHPGLSEAVDISIAHYDELYARHDLRYHLAYAAALEGTFTPVFGTIIDNRSTLFRDGDARVASLMLWHFCEEIEHRSSAVRIYDDVVGDNAYKIRIFPSAVMHVTRGLEKLLESFQRHVPGEAHAPHYGTLAQRLLGRRANPFATIPVTQRLRAVVRALDSVRGGYDHDRQPLPAWADTWFAHYDRGDDMTSFYGIGPHPAGDDSAPRAS